MKIWLILAASLLSACWQKTDHIGDYLTRLENVLERRAHKPEAKVGIAYPAPRFLTVAMPSAELTIRDFLSLRQCKLHSVIAHRNSQLGKVASASQKLFSDLNILHLGPECLKKLGNVELASTLDAVLKRKEQNLTATLWYALLGQAEHASFWHSKSDQLQYPLELQIDVRDDIVGLENFVNSVLSGQRDFSVQHTNKIERHLGRLRSGDGGRLLEEYRQLAAGLDKANSVIQQRLDSPLCLSASPSQQAHHFANVVNTRFIKNVQTHAVRLNQRADTLLSAYYRLEQPLLSYSATHYKIWAQQRDAVFKEGRSAALGHVKLLQKLYQQCGLVAGK